MLKIGCIGLNSQYHLIKMGMIVPELEDNENITPEEQTAIMTDMEGRIVVHIINKHFAVRCS